MWDQDSCQLTVPTGLLLGCSWHWDRGGRRGEPEQERGAAVAVVRGAGWVSCVPGLPETAVGHFIKVVMMAFAFIIYVVSFPLWLSFIFTGFISFSWLNMWHCRGEFNIWRRLSIFTASFLMFVLLPVSFTTPWFSLPVEIRNSWKHFISLLSWLCASSRRFTPQSHLTVSASY